MVGARAPRPDASRSEGPRRQDDLRRPPLRLGQGAYRRCCGKSALDLSPSRRRAHPEDSGDLGRWGCARSADRLGRRRGSIQGPEVAARHDHQARNLGNPLHACRLKRSGVAHKQKGARKPSRPDGSVHSILAPWQ